MLNGDGVDYRIASIAATFFVRGWVRRRPGGRAVAVTAAGAEWLECSLGLTDYR